MDSGYRLKHDNPKKNANCLSKLFFVWMGGLFYKGTQKGLDVADLYKTLESDQSKKIGDLFEKNWNDEVAHAKRKKINPSLMRVLIKTFFWNYMVFGVLLLIQMIALRSAQPVVLSNLIKLFASTNVENDEKMMYIFGALLIGISVAVTFLMHHTNYGLSISGMRVRIAVTSMVYRKIMKLNPKSLSEAAAGYIVNLLSNDVNRFDLVMLVLHHLWIMPFQVALITFLLWQEVGISCLAGVLSMAILSLPGQGYLGKLTGKLRLKIAKKTDRRVKLMNEIISGIQVIKMYAWEKPFEKVIQYARASEISDLTKTSYLRAIFASCIVFLERATLCLTVICYVLLGNVIRADQVFSMAQFFNILQLSLAIFYPMAISYGAETLVSVKRLQEFFILEEKENSIIERNNKKGVVINNLFASWVPDTIVLKDITVRIPPNALCAIVGPVGSGKSSLLQVLLGELPPTSGKVSVGGEISYSSQKPWLFASTVRNNILFGQTYDKFLYQNVIKVCALEKDLEQLPLGDKTVVGERGVSLSGGQRARINLARAVYRQADIYILDDPLSAVDTHVGNHLFEKCVMKYLEDKTRILVTHQLQYLKKADLIIVISQGKIEAQGTFDELSNSKLDFTKMLKTVDEELTEKKDNEIKEEFSIINDPRRTSVLSVSASMMSDTIEMAQTTVVNEEEGVVDVGISPFKEYFKACKNLGLIIIMIIIVILSQSACTGADYWVAFWTQQEEIRHLDKTIPVTPRNLPQQSAEIVEVYNLDSKNINPTFYKYTRETSITQSKASFYDFFDAVELNNNIYYLLKTDIAMYFYGSLIIFAIIVTLARSLLFFKMAMEASKNLHYKMFHSLLKAPMSFFDSNPSGRVLNRFSKDMGAIDEILPRVLWDAIQIILVMIGILVNVGISNPYMVIAMVVLGAVFLKIRSWYIATARDIKLLEGITKSPVFSHVNSTLNGIITIRSSNAQEILINEFDEHQDVHTSAWFLSITCVVSFGLWLDIICVIFVACVTFSFIIMQNVSAVSGSLVGLAISQSLILTGMLQHGMRQTAEVINQLTSVERVLHYTKLETEGVFDTPPEKLPTPPWPNKGLVEFRNVYLKYNKDEPAVLKNLNFTIRSTQKIGIVGRTGAGKSSLISALFRLAPIEGNIFIDGVDTKDIGLSDLRKRISIIPQEPVLFSATMRYNLDPFGEFEDSNIWKALEEVEMKDAVSTLDYMVSEGGSNFSLGQRQLICLARAILRKNNILVLDEATANVDPRTDSFIQATIRKKFKDCTVLTIAHRLHTIMDSDKVLTMSAGVIQEFDHPHNLLQIQEGYFHKMVLETGPVMSLQLKDIALNAYNNR